jgi:hypothetical protein
VAGYLYPPANVDGLFDRHSIVRLKPSSMR